MSREFWLRAKRPKQGMALWLGAAALAALGWLSTAAEAPGTTGNTDAAPGAPSRNPVRIQSEQLVADMNSDMAEFSGQVRVESEAYTITADNLTVQFKPAAEGRNRLDATISAKDISRITARGRVLIRTDTLTASADEAVYEPDLDQISLMAREASPPSVAGAKDRRTAASSPRVSSSARMPAPERVRVTVLPSSGQQ
jgi:lipopolysaccharide export system protein LptA